MTDYNRSGSGDVDALTVTTGAVVPFIQANGGVLLTATTFYFPLGSANAEMPAQTSLASVHIKWAAAVAAVITVETCNFPAKVGGDPRGAADVTDYDGTAGNWIISNPSTAIVDVVGSGNSATAATVTAGGSAAGGCVYNLGNLGNRRVRIKVVASVGGNMRVNVHGKCAA